MGNQPSQDRTDDESRKRAREPESPPKTAHVSPKRGRGKRARAAASDTEDTSEGFLSAATSDKPRLGKGGATSAVEEFDELIAKRASQFKALAIDLGYKPVPRPLADFAQKLKALKTLRLDLVVNSPTTIEHATLASLKVVLVGVPAGLTSRPRVAVKCPQLTVLKFLPADGVTTWAFGDEVRMWGDACPKVTVLHLAGSHAAPPPPNAFGLVDIKAGFGPDRLTELVIPASCPKAVTATSLFPKLRTLRLVPTALCSVEAPGRFADVPDRSASLACVALSGWTKEADGWRRLVRLLLEEGRFPALSEFRLQDVQAYCTGAGGWPTAVLDMRRVEGATALALRHGEAALRVAAPAALVAALRPEGDALASGAPSFDADVLPLVRKAGAALEVLKVGPPLDCSDKSLAEALGAARGLKHLELERMPGLTATGLAGLLAGLAGTHGQLARLKVVGRAAETDEGRAVLDALRAVARRLTSCVVKYNGSRVSA
eukprot:tig00020610_g12024.t1